MRPQLLTAALACALVHHGSSVPETPPPPQNRTKMDLLGGASGSNDTWAAAYSLADATATAGIQCLLRTLYIYRILPLCLSVCLPA